MIVCLEEEETVCSTFIALPTTTVFKNAHISLVLNSGLSHGWWNKYFVSILKICVKNEEHRFSMT